MPSPEEIARICKVLSVQTRVRIFQLLQEQVLCVGALAARLDVSQGAVSQHLRILRDANLVESEKRGNFVHYRVKPKTCQQWQETLEALLEMSDGDICDQSSCQSMASAEGAD